MELITLKAFESPIEAHILRYKLESENIEAFIFDELSVGINFYLSNAMGGVKVKIRKEDTERALSVLKEIEENGFYDDDV